MSVCPIKVCRNYKGRSKTTHNVTYHRIPTDPVLSNRWISIIRKSRCDELWNPAKHTVICSDHFRNKDFSSEKLGRRRLKKGAVPCKALFLSSVQSDDNDDTDEKNDESSENPSNTAINTSYFVSVEAGSSDISIDVQQLSAVKLESESAATKILKTSHCKDEKNSSSDSENKLEVNEEFSDLDSIYDSPKEAKMRRELRKKNILQKKHILKIQSLRRKNIRLKKKMAKLKEVIGKLKKERH